MNNIYRLMICFLGLCLATPNVCASTLFVGILSYDTFIPASSESPGVNTFNVGNFTGAFSLPPDFPITDSLLLRAAVLTLILSDSSPLVFLLGDLGPGFPSDSAGNPLVQVPDSQTFLAAEFMAIASPTALALYDGTLFTADSPFIDVVLSASSGPTLVAGLDQTTIGISGSSGAVTIPEPGSAFFLLGGLVLIRRRLR